MKRFIVVAVLVAALLPSCKKDGDGPGASESTAMVGSPETVISITDTGSHNEGSAFMYKSAQTLYFLLCEGKATSWNDGLRLPHLEVHIWEALVKDDPMAFANPSNAIDINGSDPKVYVCWKAGNGHNLFHGLTGYDFGSDGSLDGDVELLPGDELLEFLAHATPKCDGIVLMGQRRECIHGLAVEQNVELGKF